VEKKEGEGSADGAGELQKGKKWKKRGKRRGKGKRRGRWGVPALGGVGGGEGEARASPAGPVYRPARLVSLRRDISCGRAYPPLDHVVDLVRSHRHGWHLLVRTPELPWRLLWWLCTAATMAPTIDACTMRGRGEERGKRGCHGSVRVAVSPLTPAGTGVALAGVDAMVMPRTAAGSEVDDGADGQGPFVSGRKRENGGR